MVITRFPPSPTGDLHIGSVRTALYSWLYARRHHGQMVLRIEDTDLERSTAESAQAIVDGLEWLELDWDKGPYFQTQRFGRYAEVIQHLLDSGQAYRCICTKERLEALRTEQMAQKQKPKYDGCCRDKNYGSNLQEPFVIRFKTPLTGSVTWQDAVKGPITFHNEELDDLIIARSDTTPTYQLGVVVDDWDMKITHVIRGDDHINNTPRQIHILQALGAALPVYAHIPMILGSDGKRLSKRHGAVGVLYYREQGYLPEALLNYLVRLGWSHGDQEIFSREEMIAAFDLEHISSAPACFNIEKLNWLNQHYLKTLPVERVVAYWKPLLQKAHISEDSVNLASLVPLLAERCHTLSQMTEAAHYFFEDNISYDEKAIAKGFGSEAIPTLEALRASLSELTTWDEPAVHQALQGLTQSLNVGFGKIAQPLRVALTGQSVSPPMAAVAALLGRARTLDRLEKAVNFLRQKGT